MTDRELLELAAKAAGIDGWWEQPYLSFIKRSGGPWSPLDDDGEALRLALHCGMRVSLRQADADGGAIREIGDDLDDCAATRRAIVRAAAEIGKGMQ